MNKKETMVLRIAIFVIGFTIGIFVTTIINDNRGIKSDRPIEPVRVVNCVDGDCTNTYIYKKPK